MYSATSVLQLQLTTIGLDITLTICYCYANASRGHINNTSRWFVWSASCGPKCSV